MAKPCINSRGIGGSGGGARSGRGMVRSATIASAQVVDSCTARECLEDLQVFFSSEDQLIVDNTVAVKNPAAVIEAVNFEVEPIHLRTGHYAVDMTMRIYITMDAYLSREERPARLTGTAYVQKRDILCGCESTTRTFRSDGFASTRLPTAAIQVSEPVVLSMRVTEPYQTGEERKSILVTLGIFSVTSLEQPVQLVVPLCERTAMPERACDSINEGSACDVFDAMEFPRAQFFGERR